jgi:ribosome maturation factor RimP
MAIVDLKGQIEQVVEPILAGEGYDLVEIKLSRYRQNYRLQIFVDSAQGVTIGVCAHLSSLIGTALDLRDIVDAKYILEVSSPGLDRPLYSEKDFRRRVGREVEIEVVIDNKETKIRGMLTGVENEKLHVSEKKGLIEIALAQVRQGREVF